MGVWEDARQGRNVQGIAMVSLWLSNQSTKNERIKYVMALNLEPPPGNTLHTATNQKNAGATGEEHERTSDQRELQGGCTAIGLDAIEATKN